ncbi:MAG: hypothetical protein QF554_09805 [Dehalococcoidia bacterium]|nr:hypothetical protein [Dehalococcoidia bacterium]
MGDGASTLAVDGNGDDVGDGIRPVTVVGVGPARGGTAVKVGVMVSALPGVSIESFAGPDVPIDPELPQAMTANVTRMGLIVRSRNDLQLNVHRPRPLNRRLGSCASVTRVRMARIIVPVSGVVVTRMVVIMLAVGVTGVSVGHMVVRIAERNALEGLRRIVRAFRFTERHVMRRRVVEYQVGGTR